MSAPSTAVRTRDLAVVALATALALAVAFAPTPAGLGRAGQYALATMAFAAALWVTGALPLPVTSLLVPVWLTAFGVYADFERSLSGFADPVVFLFLATFVLANALRRHGIDRRIALALVAAVGTSPRRLVFGVMVASAGLSMVISNTATTAMMVPVALGLVGEVRDAADGGVPNLHVATLLGVAYGATVGGLGTVIGTPPNAIVVAQLERAVGVELSFVDWLLVGLPLVAVALPLVWAVLVRTFPPRVAPETVASVRERDRGVAPEPLSPVARRTAVVFLATAALWVAGGFGFLFEGVLPAPVYTTLFGGAGESVLGTTGHQGLLYFVLVGLLAVPALYLVGGVEAGDVVDVDWGTLVLFGGGISLADALVDTEATRWLAGAALHALEGAPLVVLVGGIVLFTVAFGELASNTATVAILAPVLVEVGQLQGPAYGFDGVTGAVFLAVTSAVAASFGFALPVATPPNAIVFGTGEVTRGQMLRVGVVLDLLMVPVTTLVLLALFALVGPLLT